MSLGEEERRGRGLEGVEKGEGEFRKKGVEETRFGWSRKREGEFRRRGGEGTRFR